MHRLRWLAVILSILLPCAAEAFDVEVRLGALANRGIVDCLERWSPTAQYLGSRIAGTRFVVVPLDHDQIKQAAQLGSVEFLLANPLIYATLEYLYGAERIATMKSRVPGGGTATRYGAVIFSRADRDDIQTLADIAGKRFAAVQESSLGGWQMARRELFERRLEPTLEGGMLRFLGTHDAVVLAVRDGEADVGTVRTDTLERMEAAGQIRSADFRVLPVPGVDTGQFPFLCSTRQYPEWPMARLRHTPLELAEQVAVALLQMPQDSPEALAGGCAGWTIPLSYESVHECLRVLKEGPYRWLGRITTADLLQQFGMWIVAGGLLFLGLGTITGVIVHYNRRIAQTNARLTVEIADHWLTDQALKQAKEQAESATRAKSEFLAKMSHEIRTPMNGVIGAADLALSEQLPPKIANYLQIIHKSAYSLLGIINDILDFSKIEAGRLELNLRPFDLVDTIDAVVDLFITKTAEKGIELLADLAPEAPRSLVGDPVRLQQVLTNLLSNAFKFTDSGGLIVLAVRPIRITPHHVRLEFSVKDTGCGIDPAFRDRLFEPFSQADDSSTRHHEGTGLGLSICKQIVTLMDGTIWLQSAPGRGSTFFFTVLLARQEVERPRQQITPADIQGRQVLVVDDCAESRQILSRILSSFQFAVDTAASGEQALAQIRATAPDLILLDHRLPDQPGLDVARRIRSEIGSDVPILLMSSMGASTTQAGDAPTAINGLLTKPIYPSSLFNAILEVFGRRTDSCDIGRDIPVTTRSAFYRSRLRGLRVLVAEDNPTNQQIARAVLESAGIAVEIAPDGEAAVAAALAGHFDAIFMDLQMPRLGGLEATQRLRAAERTARIPIIAMTAHAMKGDEEKCLEAGMDGYVAKPINQDRLFMTLWRLVGPREAPAAAQACPLPAAAAPPSGALPANLPGIELDRLRAALPLDEQTLRAVLAGFYRTNLDSAARLREAHSSGERQRLGELAHSLKGAAAGIGAVALSQAADALEAACRDASAPPPDDESVRVVIEALERVCSGLQPLDQPQSSAAGTPLAPSPAAPTAHAMSLLAELAEALRQADPEGSRNTLDQLRQELNHPLLTQLASQIAAYDFDEALQTLEQMTTVVSEGPEASSGADAT
jgi:signal transduction histidine kinase/DNA-binding response OmpR family regulator